MRTSTVAFLTAAVALTTAQCRVERAPPREIPGSPTNQVVSAGPGASGRSASGAPVAPPSPRAPLAASVRLRLDDVARVTVRVEALRAGEVVSHGSGVLVGPHRIRTAAHVVDERDAHFVAVLPSGQRAPLRNLSLTVARDVAEADIAVDGKAWIELAPPPAIGDWVVCGGFPGDVDDGTPTRSLGVLVASDALFEPQRIATTSPPHGPPVYETVGSFPDMLSVDCGIARGMSGGPVLDLEGRLVGTIVGVGVAAPAVARAPVPRSNATPGPGERLRRAHEPGDRVRRSLVELDAGERGTVAGVVVADGGLVLTVRDALDVAPVPRPAPADEEATPTRRPRGRVRVVTPVEAPRTTRRTQRRPRWLASSTWSRSLPDAITCWRCGPTGRSRRGA